MTPQWPLPQGFAHKPSHFGVPTNNFAIQFALFQQQQQEEQHRQLQEYVAIAQAPQFAIAAPRMPPPPPAALQILAPPAAPMPPAALQITAPPAASPQTPELWAAMLWHYQQQQGQQQQ